MNRKDVVLRNETVSDYKTVEELTREAFWNHHVPGCNEHYLLHIMRKADAFIPELDIVAEVNGKIVGNIVYTKAKIVDDNGDYHNVISFGPISVLPDFQGKGIGRILIEHTTTLAKELGYTAILIYGDPDYYSRFGFVAAENYKIRTSDNMYAVPLQVLELYPRALSNISGRFLEDEIYEIDEMAAKEFDKGFLPKELLSDLPTQIRFRQLVEMRTPIL
ncbi:GNAT family N-acetyltransferase [Geosporobacter ferrireducens]|uniref:GNAT family N-acetyltransferase n=1 Tax=Geosporobacter ferrireducens TaxID=1424294 RepID=A0A1D8GDG3_9FIRM|nr:N-acetyltransferase [Geosporobacter ferrireducens]AOT68936.1 GNAT family N-acetyltransferase [Geosporobacter ferrireducens]MTI54823.1 N-acetyltransferase [Geosporobacter ferrireducens]